MIDHNNPGVKQDVELVLSAMHGEGQNIPNSQIEEMIPGTLAMIDFVGKLVAKAVSRGYIDQAHIVLMAALTAEEWATMHGYTR